MKNLPRENIQVFRWWGAGEKLVGHRQKIPLVFSFPCVPFVLDTYDLTCSPLSECLEQAKICFDIHSRLFMFHNNFHCLDCFSAVS